MNDHHQHNMQDRSQHMAQQKDDLTQHGAMDHSMQNNEDHFAHNEHLGHATSAPQAMGHEDHSAHAGHGTDHSGHEQMFRVRFWWSLLLSIPVLAYSEMIQMWFGFMPPMFPLSEWIPFIFSLVIFGYGGIPFLQMAVPELKERKPGMMTLISLAISVAFIYSVAAQFINLGDGFFWLSLRPAVGALCAALGLILAGNDEAWPQNWWRLEVFRQQLPFPHFVLPWVAIAITLLACRFQMFAFLLVGLVGMSVSIHLLGQLYFSEISTW
jgi:hypothetical protein